MKKRRTEPQRVDTDFLKEMRELAKMRYLKNLEKEEPAFPEMTRLLRRTDGWNQVLFELKTKPRKENVKI